jgi:hypothetical protein
MSEEFKKYVEDTGLTLEGLTKNDLRQWRKDFEETKSNV